MERKRSIEGKKEKNMRRVRYKYLADKLAVQAIFYYIYE